MRPIGVCNNLACLGGQPLSQSRTGEGVHNALTGFPDLDIQHSLPGVAVQALLQALLVQRMPDQPDRARQHEQAIQVADLDDLLDLSLQAPVGAASAGARRKTEGQLRVSDLSQGLMADAQAGMRHSAVQRVCGSLVKTNLALCGTRGSKPNGGRTAVKSDDECSRSKNSAPMQPCETDPRITLRVQRQVQQDTSTARFSSQ